MDNWYAILGVSEDVDPDELKALEAEAQREHHPDRFVTASRVEKDRHAAQLKTCLEGVSFLLTKARDLLDKQLREERAAAERDAARDKNAKEAQERGDADDLRARFGSPPRTSTHTHAGAGQSSSGSAPRQPPPFRQSTSQSGRSGRQTGASGTPPPRSSPSAPPRTSPRSTRTQPAAPPPNAPVAAAAAGRKRWSVLAFALLAIVALPIVLASVNTHRSPANTTRPPAYTHPSGQLLTEHKAIGSEELFYGDSVAVVSGKLWYVDGGTGTLTVLDSKTLEVVVPTKEISNRNPGILAASANRVWIGTGPEAGEIRQYDARSAKLMWAAHIDVREPSMASLSDGLLWVSSRYQENRELVALDTTTGTVAADKTLPFLPMAMTATPSTAWVLRNVPAALLSLDAHTGAQRGPLVAASVTGRDQGTDVAFGLNTLWVLTDEHLTARNPTTGQLLWSVPIRACGGAHQAALSVIGSKVYLNEDGQCIAAVDAGGSHDVSQVVAPREGVAVVSRDGLYLLSSKRLARYNLG